MNDKTEKTEFSTDEAIAKGIALLEAMRGKKGSVVVMTHDEGDDGAFSIVSRSSPSAMARVAEAMLEHPRAKIALLMQTMIDHAALSDDDRVELVAEAEAICADE